MKCKKKRICNAFARSSSFHASSLSRRKGVFPLVRGIELVRDACNKLLCEKERTF